MRPGANHREVDREKPPTQALFIGFGESSLNFELRSWIASAEDRIWVRSDLYRRVEAAFAEEGVEIPFPQRDLHLRSVDEGVAAALKQPRG